MQDVIEGRVWVLGADVDTDGIIGGKYLTIIDPQELKKHVFEIALPEFAKGARPGDIIVAGENFGCGSSREHAPWAIGDYGFRVILAPSYADIFYNNCFKNGILPAELSEAQIEELFQRAEKYPGYQLSIDLPKQTVSDSYGLSHKFEIAPSRKEVLLEGLDDIATTLKHEPDITAYEKTHAATATMYDAVDVKNYSPAR
jgi:3-isopropylmalate dehydratase small subunit